MKTSLTVDLESDSQLLQSSLRAEVRDQSLRLVGTISSGGSLQLESGIYRVSAVLGDGQEYVEVVDLSRGDPVKVLLGSKEQRFVHGSGRMESVVAVAHVAQPVELEVDFGTQRYTSHGEKPVWETEDLSQSPEHDGSKSKTGLVRWIDSSEWGAKYLSQPPEHYGSKARSGLVRWVDSVVIRDVSLVPKKRGEVLLSGTLERKGKVPLKNETFRFGATIIDKPEPSEFRVVSDAGGAEITLADSMFYQRTPALRYASTSGLSISENVPYGAVLSLPGPYHLRYRNADKHVYLDSFSSTDKVGAITLTTSSGESLSPTSSSPKRHRDLVAVRDAVTWVVDSTVGLLFGLHARGKQSVALGRVTPPLALIGMTNAVEYTAKDGEWGFRSGGKDVGVAEFAARGETWLVSLPLFVPAHAEALQWRPDAPDCVVGFRSGDTGSGLRAAISPWRTIASSIQRMLLEHRYEHAARVAEHASALLEEKYSDPVGAALGALILLRVGKIDACEGWVRNLADDFAWLPDGRVVLAAVLAAKDDDSTRSEAFELLLRCTDARMMFTESHSLLLKLLRRRRKDEGQERRRAEALTTLSRRYVMIEWDALTLTTRSSVP